MKLTTSFLLLLLVSTMSPRLLAEPLLSCIDAVHAASATYKETQNKTLNDQEKLVQLLKILNRDDVLPENYITTSQAKRLGWNGDDEDSLWSTWNANKKMIGGDRFIGKSPNKEQKWYSADLESVRGFRSSKRLIYSTESQSRYLTTNTYKDFTEIPPCE